MPDFRLSGPWIVGRLSVTLHTLSSVQVAGTCVSIDRQSVQVEYEEVFKVELCLDFPNRVKYLELISCYVL